MSLGQIIANDVSNVVHYYSNAQAATAQNGVHNQPSPELFNPVIYESVFGLEALITLASETPVGGYRAFATRVLQTYAYSPVVLGCATLSLSASRSKGALAALAVGYLASVFFRHSQAGEPEPNQAGMPQ